MYCDAKKDLDYALAFTDTYRSCTDVAQREVACLRLQVPYVLCPIGEEDLVVGLMKHGFVGLSPQWGGTYTYYYHEDRVTAAVAQLPGRADAAYLQRVEDMSRFWSTEKTLAQVKRRFLEKYPQGMPGSFYFGVCRIAGMNVDLDLLVQSGLDGLKRRNQKYRETNGNSGFYDALDASVDIISQACKGYARQAAALARRATGQRRDDLLEITAILTKIAHDKPDTFKEAVQLVWIYAVCSDLLNFGRMDNYLGSFYARDIDAGVLDEEEAIRWLTSLYRNIIQVGKVHDSRIIIGGMGRKAPEDADRLALLLIEVSRRVIDVVPQLTLRYYHGMNPRLMRETMRNIELGAVYPIVYSDETTVPSIERMYGVDREMACRWVPLGCGEYIIEGYGSATPNSIITIPMALDLVLHQGVNSFTGQLEVEGMEDPAGFHTFEDLFAAYDRLIKTACEHMAYHETLNYGVAGEMAAYLHLSLLVHDCVEKGLPIFQGGCRFLTATSEVFGLITVADSLMAIKKRVYEEKRFTLGQLIAMCDANFEGYVQERNLLLTAPKYGNDDDEADAMAVRVFNHIAFAHEEAARGNGLYLYKMCSVNNSGSSDRGAVISATPCGRLRGTAISNGNSPSIGADKNGLTSTLNSMAKFDPDRHVGVVHNLRFNKDLLRDNSEKIQLVLETFFENNGVQANLSSVGRDDLEQALLHPERYQNLIVRIGGFSARFVELDSLLQQELIARTTYEAV